MLMSHQAVVLQFADDLRAQKRPFSIAVDYDRLVRCVSPFARNCVRRIPGLLQDGMAACVRVELSWVGAAQGNR